MRGKKGNSGAGEMIMTWGKREEGRKRQIRQERDSRGMREYINRMQYCKFGRVHYITPNIQIIQMLCLIALSLLSMWLCTCYTLWELKWTMYRLWKTHLTLWNNTCANLCCWMKQEVSRGSQFQSEWGLSTTIWGLGEDAGALFDTNVPIAFSCREGNGFAYVMLLLWKDQFKCISLK